jgi:hemoglobin-like flavoprotein
METDRGIPPHELRCFQASLARVTEQDQFFVRFYEHLFKQSEQIHALFEGRDLESIICKLRMTLRMVAEAAEGRPGLELYLEMLGELHRRLQVEARFFQHWRAALLATVARHDPRYDAQIEAVWQRVIDQVIASMQQAEHAPPAE